MVEKIGILYSIDLREINEFVDYLRGEGLKVEHINQDKKEKWDISYKDGKHASSIKIIHEDNQTKGRIIAEDESELEDIIEQYIKETL